MSENINNNEISKTKNNNVKQFIIWISALLAGLALGCTGIEQLNGFFNFIANIYTRLFRFIAIPTIGLAVITTLSELGTGKNTGRIFAHTVVYTLLTTFSAAIVGLLLYIFIAPGNITGITETSQNLPADIPTLTYYDHILTVIPDNILQPLVSGNVLSVIIIAASIGIGLSFMSESENKTALVKVLKGAQELLFTLIRGLLKILPFGITAFAAQLSAQITDGAAVGALGKYTLTVLSGNLIQMFIVIPIFLLIKKINPIFTFVKMSRALAVAFFTKSSAGTLPVTLSCAENNLKVNPKVSRFVLPICTTVNMNGCAAFILITSLFTMQNSGMEITPVTMITWLFISVFAAIGNAGVPMGCYFLTLSLMSSVGASLGILGVILPVYAVIDMVETVENVWSDSAVCAMTDKNLQK